METNHYVAGIDATQDALASMKAGELKVTVVDTACEPARGALDKLPCALAP